MRNTGGVSLWPSPPKPYDAAYAVSVLIFHPSVAPFVQQAARAIDEAGQLDRFLTTVRDDPGSILQRFICGAVHLTGRDLRAQFRRRAVTEVPLGKVDSYPWGELLRLATGAVDRDGRITDFVWERTENGFDRLVAGKLTQRLTGVYGFEYSSRYTFEKARSLGLKIAYDVPAPEPRFVQQILEAEVERFPELLTDYHRYTSKLEDARIAHRRAEWHSADCVIAASGYTKRSYAAAGLDVGKVCVVPYGAPAVAPLDLALQSDVPPGGPLVLIWAGTFGIRKGAHYLLEAWRKGGFGRHARLRVFGAVNLPDRVLNPLPNGVELNGSVSRPDLMEHYRKSDALIFPTLCDGFGMVVTEAWSCGLPVITTESAGAADLLKPGQNGLLIRTGNVAAIVESIEWCLAHRRELREMRECALSTAANWQWADYRRSLAETLRLAGLFGANP
jgi:glycosyltransferase involved in cell wall biosynthesis